MTMRDLAKLANVSVSAVSKAFSDAPDISEETRDHIFAVAKMHGCYNKFYKGKYQKPIIAVIASEIHSLHYTRYIEILQKIIESNGAIMLVSSFNFNIEKQAELVEYYSSYLQVDGIIVFDLKSTPKNPYDTPIVSLLNSEAENIETIYLDLSKAIHKSIKLLKGLGHKNIAFAGENLTKSKAEEFATASPENKNNIFVSDKRFEEAGFDCAKQIINSSIPITAVICAYDDIALGVIKQLKESGYSVPEDFSVIGIDNIEFSEYLETSLTSIDTHYEEICKCAWELIEKKFKNKYYKSKEPISFTAELIVRDSVTKAK